MWVINYNLNINKAPMCKILKREPFPVFVLGPTLSSLSVQYFILTYLGLVNEHFREGITLFYLIGHTYLTKYQSDTQTPLA